MADLDNTYTDKQFVILYFKIKFLIWLNIPPPPPPPSSCLYLLMDSKPMSKVLTVNYCMSFLEVLLVEFMKSTWLLIIASIHWLEMNRCW